MRIGTREYKLADDGSMDTVVNVACDCGCTWEERFSTEVAAEYRNSETGEMVRFKDFVFEWTDDEPCLDCGI